MNISQRWALGWGIVLAITGMLGCTPAVPEPVVAQISSSRQTPPRSKVSEALQKPQSYEVHKQVTNDSPADNEGSLNSEIPRVVLTTEHAAMCRVRVGDQLTEIKLPRLEGGETELASLYGKRATIVLFWQSDPWMSETALKDLAKAYASSEDLAVVGVAVGKSSGDVESTLKEAGAEFPQLIDADGKAFNKVGMTRMPRVYVLDHEGRIVWFDIEYSQSTRRELAQVIAALMGK